MPKNKTLQIQETIHKLGERLGFISKIEERLHRREHYAPVYDAVWYLNLEAHYRFTDIGELFKDAPELLERIKLLPFAGFEIEGASTSSKNQLGNFANLYSGDFLYNFVIVNNSEANGENDTYRRGVKLKRYFSENSGDKNVFFLDLHHLKRSVEKVTASSINDMCFDSGIVGERGTYGGETASVPLFDKIRPLLNDSGLTVIQNYQPWLYEVKYQMSKELSGDDIDLDLRMGKHFKHLHTGQAFYKYPSDTIPIKAKSRAESLYAPKLDVCMGFTPPLGFQLWMTELVFHPA